MSIRAGLVGLPNVGKSTLFNALTRSSVPAQNYPFCTIDPHMAITKVPDPRILVLQKIYKSNEIIPASVSFVDIAGLVKGAASGEGLGNQFLHHIREVDVILHVVRCFEDPDIIRTEELDPLGDLEIIYHELMLKDLETIKKRKEKLGQLKKAAAQKPQLAEEIEIEAQTLIQFETAIDKADYQQVVSIGQHSSLKSLNLLSTKRTLIIANVSENEIDGKAYLSNKHVKSLLEKYGKDSVIPVSARLESELAQLSDHDAQQMREMYGSPASGIDEIIRHTYAKLGLITFFTCGPREIHAWPITKGTNVKAAGGVIHSDLERGFISADVFNYKDLEAAGSEAKLREQGRLRNEGQSYIVEDGDILLIKFNV